MLRLAKLYLIYKIKSLPNLKTLLKSRLLIDTCSTSLSERDPLGFHSKYCHEIKWYQSTDKCHFVLKHGIPTHLHFPRSYKIYDINYVRTSRGKEASFSKGHIIISPIWSLNPIHSHPEHPSQAFYFMDRDGVNPWISKGELERWLPFWCFSSDSSPTKYFSCILKNQFLRILFFPW